LRLRHRSRDGDQSLLSASAPEGACLRFEANPFMSKNMEADPRLKRENIEIVPIAVADQKGVLDFHTPMWITRIPARIAARALFFSRQRQNQRNHPGRSPAHRRFSAGEISRRLARLFLIDAEGAEYRILEGAAGIGEKLYAVHVETAARAMIPGQRPLPRDRGAIKNLRPGSLRTMHSGIQGWGDGCFHSRKLAEELGFRFTLAKWKGYLNQVVAGRLHRRQPQAQSPPLYHFLRRLFLRFT